ncbi:hypothetical protein ACLOJK_025673 [Asimina triloba]
MGGLMKKCFVGCSWWISLVEKGNPTPLMFKGSPLEKIGEAISAEMEENAGGRSMLKLEKIPLLK